MQRPDTQSLTCVGCERTWERPRQGGRPPKRCPSCVQATSSPAPTAPRPTSTGVACRVCGVDDGEERAQPDLHLACVERATDRALRRGRLISEGKRKATARAARAGGELSREEVIRRMALERAGLIGTSRRGRPAKVRGEQNEHADEEADGLTADEVEHIEMITRGGGLSTDGLADG